MSEFWAGIRSLRRFFWVVWNFADFDFEPTYDLFTRGLEEIAGRLERDKLTEGWEDDVAHIRQALAAYKLYTDGWIEIDDVGESLAAEEQAWNDFHDICKKYGREWWH